MVVGPDTPQRGQLPAETTGFVGREAELARLSALLGQARLITVTGPGGIGKSRLALRAAAAAAPAFADGVCLVELAALREPGLLVHAVAHALGLPAAGLEAVLALLRDKHALLILDTCEHLIDACAMFAEAVIAGAPRVTLLATSREPLDLIGENACPVGPLPVTGQQDGGAGAGPGGSAVDLFIQRASAAVPGFTVTAADLPGVIRLCRQLDGIPLAIELAAVRLRALSLAELNRRIDQRLALLTSGQGRGGRHRTLRDAISWSHELCTPGERSLWARLSVFAGPFTMSAAEEVCADGPGDDRVMPTLIRLVDKSVLVRVDSPAAGGHPTRYLMLGAIREFGAEKLADTSAADRTRNRFVARYLAMARHLRDHFADDGQPARLRELRGEHANLRVALEYALGDPESESDRARRPGPASRVADGIELAIALSAYWRARGLPREGAYWLGRAAERAPEGSAVQVRAALERGLLLTMQGDAAGALADAAAAVALGDERLAARGYQVRAAALCAAGQFEAAAEAAAEAGRRLAALDDQPGLADLDLRLASLALLNEDIDGALESVERGLGRLDGSRERWLHASLYLLAALTLYLAGRDTEAAWTSSRALQVKHEIGDMLGTAFALEVLGWLAARGDGPQRAAWLLGGAEPLWERAGGGVAAAGPFARLHADAVSRCTDALGGRRFADLSARGARLPLEALIAFALNDGAAPAPAAPAPAAPAGGGAAGRPPSQLTAREQEIASLVAAGLSNRQIAERLFISRRTVDAHLEHIFGKLGITSRVMLTIHLREHSAEAEQGAGTERH
jgi:predicted ATPase/DNA-binding CsgD family transcriptional regulator